MDNTLVS
ncbi:Protein of unknown function [Bacillus mycoides]|nr:Protein of unknown function [Bacillus mycoides]